MSTYAHAFGAVVCFFVFFVQIILLFFFSILESINSATIFIAIISLESILLLKLKVIGPFLLVLDVIMYRVMSRQDMSDHVWSCPGMFSHARKGQVQSGISESAK